MPASHTFRGIQKYWGHPNILGDIQTYRGHPNIQGSIQTYGDSQMYGGTWTPLYSDKVCFLCVVYVKGFMPPVCLDISHMFGFPHMFVCPICLEFPNIFGCPLYVWTPPYAWITHVMTPPMCLDAPYFWMPKHALFVLCVGLLYVWMPQYVWTAPICLDAPMYVWMKKHAFFVLCVALLYFQPAVMSYVLS